MTIFQKVLNGRIEAWRGAQHRHTIPRRHRNSQNIRTKRLHEALVSVFSLSKAQHYFCSFPLGHSMDSFLLTPEFILCSLRQICFVHHVEDLNGHHFHPIAGTAVGENFCQLLPICLIYFHLGDVLQLIFWAEHPQQRLELA